MAERLGDGLGSPSYGSIDTARTILLTPALSSKGGEGAINALVAISLVVVPMAKCDQGYLCEVCGDEVVDITNSDLYLRFVLGEIEARYLMTAPERHLRCNPVQAQFIVDEGFEPVLVEGPFDKRKMPADDVSKRETWITRGWRRLQEVRSLGIPISEYPLPEVLAKRREGAPRE